MGNLRFPGGWGIIPLVPPARAERSFRFARNASWSILGHTIGIAANLLVVPFLVSRLGTELYGLYILLFAVASYMNLACLGAGASTTKYVAAFAADRDGAGLRSTLRHSLVLHAGGAAAAGLAVALAAEPIATRLFHVSGELSPTAAYLLRCAAAAAVFVALTQAALNALQGLQRFDLSNVVFLLQNTVLPAGSAALVWAGFGLREIGRWYVAVSAAAFLAGAALLAFSLRSHPLQGPSAGLPFRTFLQWSLGQWVSGWAWTMIYQFDRLFVARGVSLSGLTLYSVPASLLQRLHIVPGTISTTAMPIMSEVRGPGNAEDLRRMYLKSVRLLLWVTLPPLTLLAVFMPQFLGLWLGGPFADAGVWPARVLTAAQVFFVLLAMPNTVINTQDKPWYMPALYWSQAAVSVACWLVLIPRLGILGAALGALAAQALPGCVYIVLVHRRFLSLPLGRFAAEGLLAPAASAALTLAVLLPFHDRAGTWTSLAAFAAGGLAVYYASTWLLMSGEDRDLLKSYLRLAPARSGEV